MTLKQLRTAILSISFFVLSGGIGYWAGQREIRLRWQNVKPEITIVNKATPLEHRDLDFSLFWEVWSRLEQDYLDSSALDEEKMVYEAISGMTSSLGDPYTVFLPPKKQQESKAELSGSFEGVGIQLGYKDNRLAVIAPLDDMPAKRAGVKAGDLILHIRDELKDIDVDTDGMSLPEAVEIIRGPKDQPVTLKLARAGREPFEVAIKRETIIVKSVTLEWIEGVVYLRLSRFGDRTTTEWDQAVKEIVERDNSQEEVVGIILDIRNNPGGYLDAAVAIASEFFSDGIVVEQKGKVDSYPFVVERPGRLLNLPLVVLVNQGSASASEIVAGAIQARGRGELVGVNTFGKGTVQDAQELKGGAGLHITTARWLLPGGSWIHEEGLKPDVEVEYDEEKSKDAKYDNQVQEAIRILVI